MKRILYFIMFLLMSNCTVLFFEANKYLLSFISLPLAVFWIVKALKKEEKQETYQYSYRDMLVELNKSVYKNR